MKFLIVIYICLLSLFNNSAESQVNKELVNINNNCGLKIKFVRGNVRISSTLFSVNKTNRLNDSLEISVSKDAVHDTLIRAGDSITTDSNSVLEIETMDGSKIRLGSSSSMLIQECDFTTSYSKLRLKLSSGLIWADVRKMMQNEMNYRVTVFKSITIVDSGRFSIETYSDSGNPVIAARTYSGSIQITNGSEFALQNPNIQYKIDELEQAYREGKITINEYTQRRNELGQTRLNNSVNEKTIVPAGYEVYIKENNTPSPPFIFVDNPSYWYWDAVFYGTNK